MANYMAEVAKMLGVEIGEEFEIDYGKNRKSTANITKTGLHIIDTNMVDFLGDLNRTTLDWLLIGYCTIRSKPWKPKVDERFYVVTVDGSVMYKHWDNCSNHINYYRLGNFYRTSKEAEANRDKWISFYTSDEVLEV